jgi:DNA-binding CsgD family transcriptional regulator
VRAGPTAEAVEDFLACGQRLTDRGTRHPGMIPWQSNAALALQRLDRPRDAQGLGVARALGIALRAAGLVRGGPAGLAMLDEAASVLARSSARLEQARALTDLGAALRRANRRAEAREPLRRGLDLAVRCHATPLVERARGELVAAGARPRRAVSGVDALTPSELRVARMAAEGMSNRAIAQALFVTVKTVEVHLGSAYRKTWCPVARRTSGRAGGRPASRSGERARNSSCEPRLTGGRGCHGLRARTAPFAPGASNHTVSTSTNPVSRSQVPYSAGV